MVSIFTVISVKVVLMFLTVKKDDVEQRIRSQSTVKSSFIALRNLPSRLFLKFFIFFFFAKVFFLSSSSSSSSSFFFCYNLLSVNVDCA